MHAHPPSHQCRCFQEAMKGPVAHQHVFPLSQDEHSSVYNHQGFAY